MFYFSSFICPAAGRSPTVSPYCICIWDRCQTDRRSSSSSSSSSSSIIVRPLSRITTMGRRRQTCINA